MLATQMAESNRAQDFAVTLSDLGPPNVRDFRSFELRDAHACARGLIPADNPHQAGGNIDFENECDVIDYRAPAKLERDHVAWLGVGETSRPRTNSGPPCTTPRGGCQRSSWAAPTPSQIRLEVQSCAERSPRWQTLHTTALHRRLS